MSTYEPLLLDDEEEAQVAESSGEKASRTSKKNKIKKKSIEAIDMKLDHSIMQATNSIYEHMYSNLRIDLGFVEKCFLSELLSRFNNTQVSKLTGLSVRTIRNKKRAYGLK